MVTAQMILSLNLPVHQGIQELVPGLSRSSSQRNQSLYDQSYGPNLLHGVGDLELFKHKLTEFFSCFPEILLLAATPVSTINPWSSGTSARR